MTMGMRSWRSFFFCAMALATFTLVACAASGTKIKTKPTPPEAAAHRGFYELGLVAQEDLGNPFFDTQTQIVFIRPNGTQVTVDAFFDGDKTFRARAYCDTTGLWRWRSESNRSTLHGKTGQFQVSPSALPGKLRIHPKDPRQMAYDDGRWFLHIGDTAYRYVVDAEPNWQAYIDQAAQVGFTKIRVWFARSRSFVEALLTEDRTGINLPYWQEMERRLLYALQHYPHIIFQVIPYAEDAPEVIRYGAGDRASRFIGRYAQARLSALPNVTWVMTNDLTITVPGSAPKGDWRDVDLSDVDQIGKDFRAREPWGTLLANHQARFTGNFFVDAPWSDLIVLEDLDQVDGRLILEYRKKRAQPVILDEDRYEKHRNPGAPRYFFRRLMWASILSGGHGTYGSNRMFEAFDGTPLRGIHGYMDLVRTGGLEQGAHDFVFIKKFFADAGLTTVGLSPDDNFVGAEPRKFKCLRNDNTIIVYSANPSGDDPRTDVPAWDPATVKMHLPDGAYRARWFDPSTGAWHEREDPISGRVALPPPPPTDLSSSNDWVLLLSRLTTNETSTERR